MEWWILLIVAAVALSALGPVIWFVAAVLLAKKVSESTAFRGPPGGLGALGGFGDPDLDALLAQIDQMMRAAAAGQGASPGKPGAGGAMTPQQQLQLQAMLMQAQNQMAQLDNLSRQRYETSMSGLQGYAAANGIDWSPGSF